MPMTRETASAPSAAVVDRATGWPRNWGSVRAPTTPRPTPRTPPTSPSRLASVRNWRRMTRGVSEELAQDDSWGGTQRLAQADLTDPLRDRHEHDVHDADPADEQRDRRDATEQHREGAGRAGRGLHERGLAVDLEVGGR